MKETYDDPNRIEGVNGYYIYRRWKRLPDGRKIKKKKAKVFKIWVSYDESEQDAS